MDNTYHNYQRILDFQGPELHELKQRKPRRKFKKSIDGCLSCKKRRKKCDENKPVCSGCVRNELECVWPEHVTRRMSKGASGFSSSNSTTTSTATTTSTSSNNTNKNAMAITTSATTTNDKSNADINNLLNDTYLLDQLLDIQLENDMTSPKVPMNNSLVTAELLNNLNPYNSWIPGVPLSKQDSLCYDYFVNKFLPSISAPHCHHLLSPLTTLLPYASTNALIRSIFFACGATLLAYSNDSYSTLAHEKYVKAVDLLIRSIKESEDGCEDALFISVQLLQTLCLRDKNIGLNATKSAAHLSAAYEIIKKRFRFQSQFEPIRSVKPLDRILTEHFVFNYPITMLLCRHDKLSQVLPSPYEFYDKYTEILAIPLNPDNNDPWLNHPILGVGLKSLEISAKCTWICRLNNLPLDQASSAKIIELKQQTLQELSRIEEYSSKTTITSHLQNISIARQILFASLIIIKKLHNYTITMKETQPEVDRIKQEVEECMARNDQVILPIWVLFIAASTANNIDQRNFFKKSLFNVSNLIKSSLVLKMIKYLNTVWSEDSNNEMGFEFLFDTKVLDIISN